MFAVHKLRVEKSVVRVLLLHYVEETGLWSCWTCVCQESLFERTKSCELSDWWQIGRDRRQSLSVYSVNKIQVLNSMIGAVNVSRMQIMYVWRSRCAYRLSLELSLREREDQGLRFSLEILEIWAPSEFVSCQGVRLDCGPLLFGYNSLLRPPNELPSFEINKIREQKKNLIIFPR
jgi:hypothetical protein